MVPTAVPPNTRFTQLATLLLTWLLTSFGVWTLGVWLATWNRWSFSQLLDITPYLGVGTLLLLPICFVASRRPALLPADPSDNTSILDKLPAAFFFRWWPAISLLLLLPALALTASRNTGHFSFEWLLFATSCLVLALPTTRAGITPPGQTEPPITTRVPSLAWYLLVVVILVAAYAFSTNTDADDTHFLGAAVSLIEHPDQEIFRFDSMFGEQGLPNYIFQLNRGQSWEALSALLTSVANVDLLDAYYWWLPLLFILLIPLPLYLLLVEYYPRQAWFGVIFACLFLLAWSTFNYHAGQFFIPRFFQGKSVLLSVLVPSLFLSTREVVRSRSVFWTLILSLLLIASAGMTSTGLYLGVAIVGLAFLAYASWSPRDWLIAGGLLFLASLPNLAMLVDISHHIATSTGHAAGELANVPPPEAKNASMYGQFGGGKTLAAILLLSWLAIFYARSNSSVRNRNGILRLMLVIVVFAYNRPLAELLTSLTGIGNVVWRWHWSIPMGLVLALSASGALAYAQATKVRVYIKPDNLFHAGLAALPLLALLGLVAINAGYLANRYSFQARTWKVYPPQRAILEHLRQQDLQGKNILADTRVSQLLPRFPHRAKVVAPGYLYWLQPYFNAQESETRYRLEKLIDGQAPLSQDDKTFLSQQIVSRNIDLVIYDAHSRAAPDLDRVTSNLDMSCQALTSWTVCSRK